MRVKLLADHFINDVIRHKDEILDLTASQITPLMEGLDPEARQTIAREKIDIFGRYRGIPHGFPPGGRPLIDNPPISRPLDDNQPVYHFVGRKEYIS